MKLTMMRGAAAMAAFCATFALSHATASFHNTGTIADGGGFSNWDSSNLDSNCSLSDSTSVVYKGSTSFKAQTNYNSSYTGRYHAMKSHNNGYVQGDTGFYGFAFYLQSSWDFSGTQDYTIFQFIADYTGSGCDTWQPSTMVWLVGNQLYTRRNYGSGPCSRTTQSYSNLATVTAGVWHRIVIQAHWASDTTGYLKLWYDGTKVCEKLSIANTINSTKRYRMDVGIYSNGWHDDGFCTGSTTRMAWFDQIGIGSTFADADPAQW